MTYQPRKPLIEDSPPYQKVRTSPSGQPAGQASPGAAKASSPFGDHQAYERVAQAMCNAAWTDVNEDWGLASDEQRDEFRLMARAALKTVAAAELYDALEAFVRPSDPMNPPEVLPLVQAAKAALRKARGQS